MIDRVFSCVVALSLALLVWVYSRSRDQEILDNVPVPVQVALTANQADQFAFELGGNAQVLVSFSGSPARIRELRGILQRGELQAMLTYNVPESRLGDSRINDTLVVGAADLHAPPGVTALPVEGRNRVPITLFRLVERRLPVRVDQGLTDPAISIELEPSHVVVRGPQEILERARAITTQPVTLPARAPGSPFGEPAVVRAALLQELEGRAIRAHPNHVLLRVKPQVLKTYDLPDVPIHFLCPANLTLRPRFIDERAGRVSLRIQGPAQDEPPRVAVYIDLTRGRFTAGLNHEQPQLQLPREFTLVQELPKGVAFELTALESTPMAKPGLGTLKEP